MPPVVVGITLAASVSSAATFIINPGFVYVDGLSAFMHFTVASGMGFFLMLYLLSFRFRRIGAESGALTMPDWIGKRYASCGFALYFAVLNLLSFAFVVLLVGGISIVMQSLLGVSNTVALVITLTFVTGYVFAGGTHAHVLTNLLQGSLMIVVTLVVLGSCVWLAMQQPESMPSSLRAIDENLVALVNPEGALFNSVFSIYVAGFVVGAVVVCQPHILTKALYVKDDRAVRRYLMVFAVIFVLFQLLAAVGLFAHLAVSPEALVDASTGQFRQDLVMTSYLRTMFPPWVFTIVGIVLLAAAMSTLDGLLVSISTITANDILRHLMRHRDHLDEPQQMQFAMRASHGILVLIAVAAFVINLQPPKLLGIFGQVGVYGLTAAAAPPLLLGVLFRRVPLWLAGSASILAISLHFLLFFRGADWFPESSLTFANPAVTVSLATLIALPAALLAVIVLDRRLIRGV